MNEFPAESSALVEAQQTAAPAVITLTQYRSNRVSGGGTGFIIDASGLALTNKHVVDDSRASFRALLMDGAEYDVEVKAMDPLLDVAIIQLIARGESGGEGEPFQFPFVSLGESSRLNIGDCVLAIGNALAQYENTTTAGIISAKGRQLVASDALGNLEKLSGLLQTDAAINLGNSGGPLVNLKGEVIGINTAVDVDAQGIGFAIPIDVVKVAVESWKETGEISRPVLGVHYLMLSPSKAYELGFEEVTSGALILQPPDGSSAIVSGSSAARAGLEIGDVIVAVDGKMLTVEETLQDVLLRKRVGEVLLLRVWREKIFFEVRVELTNGVSPE
jgi:2-alkenal reductase